jgi:ComF family protein
MGEATALRVEVIRTCVDALVAVLVAPGCAACREPLDRPTESAACPRCWDAIVPIAAPFCDGCGEPLPSWRIISVAGQRCARCRRRPPAVVKARAAGAYDGALRRLLQAFKYERRRSLARPLGVLMQRHGREVLEGADIAVPVPLHARRQRSRGFNQAEDLARHVGVRVVPALRRTRATTSQADLPAARRHANVRHAFTMRHRVDVRGLRVVLVDDVSTTGATLDACARVLLNAGALEVRALTAARAVARNSRDY